MAQSEVDTSLPQTLSPDVGTVQAWSGTDAAKTDGLTAVSQWRQETAQRLHFGYASVEDAAEGDALTGQLQIDTQRCRTNKLTAVAVELARKQRVTHRLVSGFAKKQTSLEQELRNIEITIRKLLQADEAISAPLEVVNTRLTKRAEREPGELTKDEAHVCLLDERRILLTNRQLLQNGIETAQRMHHSVGSTLEELAEDLASKKATWRIDEACLQSVPGYLLRAPPSAKLDPGPQHPEDRARLETARELFRRVQKKEKMSISMREQFAVLIARSTRDTANCREKTESALAVRTAELLQLEKQLEGKRKHVDNQIRKHKLEMGRTAWQKRQTEQCQQLVKAMESSRRHRKNGENVEDEVSCAVAENFDFFEDNCKELQYCAEDNAIALRQLERAREVISCDVERKRRTLKLESSCRAGGGHSGEQSWATKTTSEDGADEEANDFWGKLFQPAEEPSPSPSPDILKASDELTLEFTDKKMSLQLTPRAKKTSGYDPHAATMREEDLEALRSFNRRKRQQKELQKREEEKRIAMYYSKRQFKEVKVGTKEELRVEAEEEKRRRREELVRRKGESMVLTLPDSEIPGIPLLCRKGGRGPKGDRRAFSSPIYS